MKLTDVMKAFVVEENESCTDEGEGAEVRRDCCRQQDASRERQGGADRFCRWTQLPKRHGLQSRIEVRPARAPRQQESRNGARKTHPTVRRRKRNPRLK